MIMLKTPRGSADTGRAGNIGIVITGAVPACRYIERMDRQRGHGGIAMTETEAETVAIHRRRGQT